MLEGAPGCQLSTDAACTQLPVSEAEALPTEWGGKIKGCVQRRDGTRKMCTVIERASRGLYIFSDSEKGLHRHPCSEGVGEVGGGGGGQILRHCYEQWSLGDTCPAREAERWTEAPGQWMLPLSHLNLIMSYGLAVKCPSQAQASEPLVPAGVAPGGWN